MKETYVKPTAIIHETRVKNYILKWSDEQESKERGYTPNSTIDSEIWESNDQTTNW